MSVAFRRESDEEHLEPKFEIPLPSGPNLVTPRGLAMITDRIAELETALADSEADTRAPIARDLRYWRTRRSTASVTAPPPDGTAGFATRVAFRLNGADRTIEIVGDDEADPAAGRIAWSAPLARAISGAEVGEDVDFNGRIGAIRVLSIDPIDE